MTTETIIALVMFPIVGAIVSLDVTGLTLSKSLKFAKEKRSIFWWAITNACWHAGLLTVYILIFHGFFEFSLDFLDELKKILLHVASFFDFIKLDLKEYVVVLFDLINQHAKLMLGLIALFIVW